MERAEDVARVTLLYDILMAEALPRQASIDLARTAIEMDLTGAAWRKSSLSSGNGGACVEVAILPGTEEGDGSLVALRDSKDPAGPALVFAPGEWRAFTSAIRHRESAQA